MPILLTLFQLPLFDFENIVLCIIILVSNLLLYHWGLENLRYKFPLFDAFLIHSPLLSLLHQESSLIQNQARCERRRVGRGAREELLSLSDRRVRAHEDEGDSGGVPRAHVQERSRHRARLLQRLTATGARYPPRNRFPSTTLARAFLKPVWLAPTAYFAAPGVRRSHSSVDSLDTSAKIQTHEALSSIFKNAVRIYMNVLENVFYYSRTREYNYNSTVEFMNILENSSGTRAQRRNLFFLSNRSTVVYSIVHICNKYSICYTLISFLESITRVS